MKKFVCIFLILAWLCNGASISYTGSGGPPVFSLSTNITITPNIIYESCTNDTCNVNIGFENYYFGPDFKAAITQLYADPPTSSPQSTNPGTNLNFLNSADFKKIVDYSGVCGYIDSIISTSEKIKCVNNNNIYYNTCKDNNNNVCTFEPLNGKNKGQYNVSYYNITTLGTTILSGSANAGALCNAQVYANNGFIGEITGTSTTFNAVQNNANITINYTCLFGVQDLYGTQSYKTHLFYNNTTYAINCYFPSVQFIGVKPVPIVLENNFANINLIVQNNGNAPLNITKFTVDNTDFSIVVGELPFSLNPGVHNFNATLQYTGTGTMPQNVTFTVYGNTEICRSNVNSSISVEINTGNKEDCKIIGADGIYTPGKYKFIAECHNKSGVVNCGDILTNENFYWKYTPSNPTFIDYTVSSEDTYDQNSTMIVSEIKGTGTLEISASINSRNIKCSKTNIQVNLNNCTNFI